MRYLQVGNDNDYLMAAIRHLALSLPGFRKELAAANEQNCHALFAVGHLFTKISFAMPPEESQTFLLSPEPGVVAEFIYYLRGSFSVHDSSVEWLQRGPCGSCLEYPLDNNPPFDLNPDDEKLAQLELYLCNADGDDAMIYVEALDDLRRIFAMIHTPKQTISVKTLVYCWLARVSSRYLELMSERRPEALVLLAHYCVMLQMVG